MAYLWVALGSALGGMARFGCSGLAARLFGETFPWGTLIVNVAGSLLIGCVAGVFSTHEKMLLASECRAFLMIGVLGGFTTFSTFSLETLNLARDGQWPLAGANVGSSLVLCLLAVWIGYAGAAALAR